MKQIKNGLLYHTDKSRLLWKSWLMNKQLYISPNGILFMVWGGEISNTNQESLKEFLGTINPDKYIELFGEVEEV